MADSFFPQRPSLSPKIYAYAIDDESHKGQLKVGYTDRDVRQRIAEQTKTAQIQVRIVLEESAMRNDSTAFDDHAVHRLLSTKFQRMGGEWFRNVDGSHAGFQDAPRAAGSSREDSTIFSSVQEG